MREELIRVENGCFRREDEFYRFEISISRGECIGVYVDDHFTSGTAYLDLFKGGTHLERGRAFSCGRRVGPLELERWILQNARIVNWHRFHSQELTVRDFLLALDRPAGWPQRWGAVRRLHSPESQEIRQRMELRVPLESRLADLSLLDYYRLCVFRVWFWRGELLVLDRITEILRRRDVEKLMECVQLLLRQGTAVFLLDLDETFMYRYCDRIDVIRDRRTCYRLYPEEYGEQLYAVLGWKPRDRGAEHTECRWEDKQVLRLEGIGRALLNSVLRTVLGTAITVVCCSFLGYLFTKEEMPAKKLLYRTLIVTMYVSGGLIPTFLTYRAYGLMNNFLVYILPGCISAFNVLVMRSFIQGLPYELIESAKIDGASEYRILFGIVFPLSMPVIATIGLFVSVSQWNQWFDTMLYCSGEKDLITLQYELKRILDTANSMTGDSVTADAMASTASEGSGRVTTQTIRAAMTVISGVPIACVYPFLQKYFVKGLTLGAVKG